MLESTCSREGFCSAFGRMIFLFNSIVFCRGLWYEVWYGVFFTRKTERQNHHSIGISFRFGTLYLSQLIMMLKISRSLRT